MKDNAGCTPMDIALIRGKLELAELLNHTCMASRLAGPPTIRIALTVVLHRSQLALLTNRD